MTANIDAPVSPRAARQSGLSRRGFLKSVGVASIGIGLAACQPGTAPAKGEAAPGTVRDVTVWWGGWTPTQSMERSEDNPLPHNKILAIMDSYTAENPAVAIEWIRIPRGMNSRDWTIAQQAAGTIPHLVTHGHWHIKDDLDKGWWVELTPFLDGPNPYIAEGDAGSERWLDQFFPIPTEEARMRGGFYNLVFGLITTFFYYNVDWFNEMGVGAPQTYSQFLEVCQAFREVDVNAYGGQTYGPSSGSFWYRVQLGGMIMARDIEPLVNPDRGTATYEEVACAIKNGVYHPHLAQYRQWMELWKRNVPYRTPDWTISPTDSHTLFLRKVEPIMENGSWSIPRLLNDPQMDFEWATFYAPTLTDELSEFVSNPAPPAWPIGGPVGDQFAAPTSAQRDGVLDDVIDLLRYISVPDNLHTIQSEIGTTMPNIKNVPVDPRFAEPFELLTTQIGETQMFVYEEVKMDGEAAEAIGNYSWSYQLDQIDLDTALDGIAEVFNSYADRFIENEGLAC